MAEVLLQERLAACAQIMGPLSSTYRWKDTLEHASEFYCHLKTTMERLPALQTRIRELHPYEVPEIVALPIIGGDAAYLKWIESEVSE
jgi:periplasmic divalent cation tolerance protein